MNRLKFRYDILGAYLLSIGVMHILSRMIRANLAQEIILIVCGVLSVAEYRIALKRAKIDDEWRSW